jgi:hypothetical protein
LKTTQWHDDCSILPSTIFLRAELAAQTDLKAALGIPLMRDNRVVAVCIFYKRYAQAPDTNFETKVIAMANEAMASACAIK